MILMKVKDRMTPNPYTTTPDAGVGDTWLFLIQHGLTRLPVMDRGKLLGILTKKDFGSRPDLNFRGTSIATRYFSTEETMALNKVKVRDILPVNQSLVTISPDAYIEQAAKLLQDNKISGLPVVDDDGKLIGIITQTDISNAFMDILAINQNGVRLNMRVKNTPDTLIKIGQILSDYGVKFHNVVTLEVKNEDPMMILRFSSNDSKAIINDLKAAGFVIESVIIKR